MPSAESVELVLRAVPGVEEAVLNRESDRRTSLHIRVADGHEPRSVAEAVSRALRERFSIDLAPESLLRPPAATPPTPRPLATEHVRPEPTGHVVRAGEQSGSPTGQSAEPGRRATPPPTAPTSSGTAPEDSFRLPSGSGPAGDREIQLVDAVVEGEGLGRRAVVVVNQTGPSGVQTAMGATLVGSSDALAVASATLQALSDLD
ncbi:MAG: hypothetical protein R3249_08165 [Nitriliruptorales bacterium]|nr:hypothetical protein [Nitriliruptorales bacterium]